MENNKLGKEPAFGFGYEKQHFYLNQPGKYRTPEKELGMSKRFYAACAAMQGMVSDPNVKLDEKGCINVAEMAYRIADELLKQENL